MARTLCILAASLLAALTPPLHAGESARGPQGFGARSRGGQGGRPITVANLNDAGPGSLREALTAEGPRVVHFGVGGTIRLQSPIRISHGRVTIDGASAPGSGITLLNHGLHFVGDCDDIVVRHLRIRVTTGGASGDALLFWGHQGGTVERVLVDHCSLMWATDDVVNNVIYNWTHHNATKIGGGARVNVAGCSYIAGPQSTDSEECILVEDPGKGTRVHVNANVSPLTPAAREDPWRNVTWWERVDTTWKQHRPVPDVFRAAERFNAPAVDTQSAEEACALVLEHAGARIRDADDIRVVEEVRKRSGRVGRGPREDDAGASQR